MNLGGWVNVMLERMLSHCDAKSEFLPKAVRAMETDHSRLCGVSAAAGLVCDEQTRGFL